MPKTPNFTTRETAVPVPDGAAIMTGGFLACGQAHVVLENMLTHSKEPHSVCCGAL